MLSEFGQVFVEHHQTCVAMLALLEEWSKVVGQNGPQVKADAGSTFRMGVCVLSSVSSPNCLSGQFPGRIRQLKGRSVCVQSRAHFRHTSWLGLGRSWDSGRNFYSLWTILVNLRAILAEIERHRSVWERA